MAPPSHEERAIYRTLSAELRRRQVPVIVEHIIRISQKPLRFRQVDLAVTLPDGRQMWVEIDGPNHRGARNRARDQQLVELANDRQAVLLHVALWMVMHHGLAPFVEMILRGESHHGHAEQGVTYRVWDSRYSH